MKKILFGLFFVINCLVTKAQQGDQYVKEFLQSPYFDTLMGVRADYSLDVIGQFHLNEQQESIEEFNKLVATANEYSELEKFFEEHRLNNDFMLDRFSILIAAHLKFQEQYEDFFNLPEKEQIRVFTAVKDSINSFTFQQTNPDNILISRLIKIQKRRNCVNCKLSIGNIADCAFDAFVGGAITTVLQSAGTIFNMIKGKNLSTYAIGLIVKNALKGAAASFPWGAILGFAWCIASEAFDWSPSNWF